MMRPSVIQGTIRAISRLNEAVGRATSWLCILLVLVTVFDVTMRYVFARGSIALQELQWHLYSLIFLLGAGYTLSHNAHVRVDILYGRLQPRWRAWIELLGGLLLLLPFVIVVIYTSYDFVAKAWQVREPSPNPGGLPTWFLLKTFIPIGFGLLGLQGIAKILQASLILAGRSVEASDGRDGREGVPHA
jgi:TRAP-type mannitol/chloroaromatic compound transport system permease small subunit